MLPLNNVLIFTYSKVLRLLSYIIFKGKKGSFFDSLSRRIQKVINNIVKDILSQFGVSTIETKHSIVAFDGKGEATVILDLSQQLNILRFNIINEHHLDFEIAETNFQGTSINVEIIG